MIGVSVSVIIGIIIGLFYKNVYIIANIDKLINIGLCLLLFFIGMDIGKNKEIKNDIKKLKLNILFLPFVTIIASLIGGFLASFILGVSSKETIAISSGMGWYSFSAVVLSKVDGRLGSIAFLSNVFREMLSIFFIPFIAKKIGSLESVAAAGATAMDSVLPIINKNNPPKISIISFYSGFVISVIVPVLVPFIVQIFKL